MGCRVKREMGSGERGERKKKIYALVLPTTTPHTPHPTHTLHPTPHTLHHFKKCK
ncbi:MAG: hypothetical protein F6J93_22115 [Oscillatoria sp. SIO1A7]|nr:hypothetical protein [Oscillatoria sp. SIO1A7]